jgi:lysophospholipase L1-like esterase
MYHYLLSAWDAPLDAGRLADFNLLGSVAPSAAGLEWVALGLLLLAAGLVAVHRASRCWRQVGLLIGTVALVLWLEEGVARMRVAVSPTPQGFPTYSSAAWMRRHVRLNAEGFRNTEHSTRPVGGGRRLLVVGDSFAFGWGVARTQDRLGEQLGARLGAQTGEPWEAINASRADSHTLHHIEFLRRALVYQPDIVVLVYVFNDLQYFLPIPPEGEASRLEKYYPHWVLFRNSYLFQEVFVRLRLISYHFFGSSLPDPYVNAVLVERHLQDLKRFVQMAEQAGARVQVVPFRIVVNPPWKRSHREFVRRAEAEGIPICSLEETYRGLEMKDLIVGVLDVHPSEKANHMAADTVARCLGPQRKGL